jgi:hypothetical protein
MNTAQLEIAIAKRLEFVMMNAERSGIRNS